MQNLRRAQERLGRNAAPVEANATEIFALDNRGLESELCRSNGGDVTAGPRPDDEDVVCVVSHSFLAKTRLCRTLSTISALVAGRCRGLSKPCDLAGLADLSFRHWREAHQAALRRRRS